MSVETERHTADAPALGPSEGTPHQVLQVAFLDSDNLHELLDGL